MSYSKSIFSYNLREEKEHKIISIIDEFSELNPSISVTNDIENVLKDIAAKSNIDPKEYIVIYRDTDNYWCGFDPIKNDFNYFLEETEQKAIEIAITIKEINIKTL